MNRLTLWTGRMRDSRLEATRTVRRRSRHRPLAYHRLEFLESRQLLSLPPGSFDPTFGGGDGYVQLSLVNKHSAFAYSVALQPVDNETRILVAGTGYEDGSNRWQVVRLTSTGELDTTFGTGGRVLSLITGYAYDMALQPDGKIVLAGYFSKYTNAKDITTSDNDIAIVRLNPNGSLDTSFGAGDGTVLLDLSTPGESDEYALSVAIQADGKIVVGGFTSAGSNTANSILARFNPSGDLDTEFGQDGMLVTSLSAGYDCIYGLAIQADGKIVVAESSQVVDLTSTYKKFLARYDTDGNLDVSFGPGGRVELPYVGGQWRPGAHPVEIQPEDRSIVWTGVYRNGTDTDIALVRLTPGGSYDTTFGDAGTIALPLPGNQVPHTVTVQPDGRLVVVGYVGLPGTDASTTDPMVARFHADGSPDVGFGAAGLVVHSFGSLHLEEFTDVAVQPDGRIVAAGYASLPGTGTPAFLVARFVGASLPGVEVWPAAGLVTTEAGGTATFTVQLMTPPTADVTIALGSSDMTEGTVPPASLTFTPDDWNKPQVVTITGVDDAVADGDIAYTITLGPVASADPAYAGLVVAPVSVTNRDDDCLTVTYTNPTPLAIPDGKSATSTLAVPDAGTIQSVTLTVKISHPSPADLALTLVAPDGTSYALNATLVNGSNTFTGLTAFNGHPLNGTWKLIVTDKVRNKKVGTLLSWSLGITYVPPLGG